MSPAGSSISRILCSHEATPIAIFTDLCAKFQLADAVRDQILTLALINLTELRHFVTKVDELWSLPLSPPFVTWAIVDSSFLAFIIAGQAQWPLSSSVGAPRPRL